MDVDSYSKEPGLMRTVLIHRLITLFASLLVFGLPITSSGQDRDITGGSSTGSIRPDVLDVRSGPRTRMLTPEKRARLVAEFDLFRGAETLLNTQSFEALKEDYRTNIEKVASERPIATDLTPLKYLVLELMARDLSNKKPGTRADELAKNIISTYVKTGDFMPPILSAGFNRSEAKKAERDAVALVKKVRRSASRQ
jgi:hypothetical protein